MSGPTLRYESHEPIPATPQYDLAGRRRSQILGAYIAVYADGLNVAVPHVGVPGTIGAEPLGLNDPEERAVLIETLERLRQHNARMETKVP